MNVYEYLGTDPADVDAFANFCRMKNCAAYVEVHADITFLVTDYPIRGCGFKYIAMTRKPGGPQLHFNPFDGVTAKKVAQ